MNKVSNRWRVNLDANGNGYYSKTTRTERDVDDGIKPESSQGTKMTFHARKAGLGPFLAHSCHTSKDDNKSQF